MGFLQFNIKKHDSSIAFKTPIPRALNTERIVGIEPTTLNGTPATKIYYNETLPRPTEFYVLDNFADIVNQVNAVGSSGSGGGGGSAPTTLAYNPTTRVLTVNGSNVTLTPNEGQLLSWSAGTNVLSITNGAGTVVSQVDLSSLVTAGTPTGEVNVGANVGAGEEVFRNKTGATFNFRGIAAGANISVTTVGDDIVIAASNYPNVVGANVGTGTGLVFKNKVSDTLNFKTIKAGTGITLVNGTDDITINATASTAANIGAEAQVYVTGSAAPFNFRTVYSSDGSIVVTQETDKIDIKQATQNPRRNLIIANQNNQLTFTLTHTPINVLDFLMVINGQVASQDMFSVAANVATFNPTTAGYQIDIGDKVEFIYYSAT